MSAALFQVEIVSPAKPLFRGEAGSVVAEAFDGEVGIRRGHAPLMSMLGTGVVHVRYSGLKEGGESFAVRGGFLQVMGEKVTLLVTEATRAEDVDAAAVRAEKAEVVAGLQHPSSDEDYRLLLDRRRWCDARLKIAAR